MSLPSGTTGLSGALKDTAATLLATGRTRLALLSNELEVEKLRAFRVLVLTQALMFCLGLAIVLATVLAIYILREQPTISLSILSAMFFVASGFFYRRLIRATAQSQPLFTASLAELQEDLRQLKAAASTPDH